VVSLLNKVHSSTHPYGMGVEELPSGVHTFLRFARVRVTCPSPTVVFGVVGGGVRGGVACRGRHSGGDRARALPGDAERGCLLPPLLLTAL
jgi:hypothetical protein